MENLFENSPRCFNVVLNEPADLVTSGYSKREEYRRSETDYRPADQDGDLCPKG
jgi:hypothetical protein